MHARSRPNRPQEHQRPGKQLCHLNALPLRAARNHQPHHLPHGLHRRLPPRLHPRLHPPPHLPRLSPPPRARAHHPLHPAAHVREPHRDLTVRRPHAPRLWITPDSPLPAPLGMLPNLISFSLFGCWRDWCLPPALAAAILRLVAGGGWKGCMC
ncbi:hypothetical protein B0H14DRAFT_3144693 [Mycena olivaceomarginata]|nr:hypothetical protein B0H14DRAFT_3144693 [Mycena olivaceomarginata]